MVNATKNKKLFRNSKNRMLAGIFGGLGEYLETDSTILRIVFVLITIFSGFVPGLIAYLAAWLIIPEEK